MKTYHVGGVNPLRRYKTLEAALKEAKDDDTIEIHKNLIFSGKVKHNIILKGNGHSVTVSNGAVGFDCEDYIVMEDLTVISEPRANAIILRNGGRLKNVTAKIKGPARTLYPTIILKAKTLELEHCNIMRMITESGTTTKAKDTTFCDYYGAVFYLENKENLSVFSGVTEFQNCTLDCCQFQERTTLKNCEVKAFNRSTKDLTLINCHMHPTVNKPAVNLKKEPSDGPLETRNENSRFSIEGEKGDITVKSYTSEIPEEFVGFHIQNGSLIIQDTNNTDKNGYHIIRNGSVTFTDVMDAAYYEITNAKLSNVRSTINTSVKTKTAMERLNELIGLNTVKENIQSIVNTIARNQKAGNKDFSFSYHMVFAGDPGTGKTTVAKIVAQALFEIGAIPENKCTEVAADSLIKGFVGQTAEHVRNVLDSALGGVLFIDEAYELTVKENQNSFNSDALSVLIRYMEDHRDNLVVIAAGYEKEMREFLASNVGLTRRFQWVSFPDYSIEEMTAIFELIRDSYEEEYEDAALYKWIPPLFTNLVNLYKRKPDAKGRITNGGNGGLVRNVFQQVLIARNNRIAENPNSTDHIIEADIKAGFRQEMEKAVSV